MEREKYESLNVSALRDIAKARGIKGVSTIKKSDIINLMLELDEEEEKGKKGSEEETKEKKEAKTSKSMEAKSEAAETKSKASRAAGKEGGKKDKKSSARSSSDKNKKISKKGDTLPPSNDEGIRAESRGSDSKEPLRSESEKPKGEKPERVEANVRPDDGLKSENSSREGQRSDNRSASEEAIETEKTSEQAVKANNELSEEKKSLDSGIEVRGILDVLPEGYGFIRSDNYMPGENDIYVAPSQIRRFSLRTGDIVVGNMRIKNTNDKFGALLFVKTINDREPDQMEKRIVFEDLTPIFPTKKITLERVGGPVSMRIMDLMSPVGKGQRGMIVSPPKAGKTTLLKDVAKSLTSNYPDIHLIILLIDERPEEVTDMKEAIKGDNVEVIYSTFDELPEHHKRVSEMVIERAKRLVEYGRDVVILLDSITRLTRAYNLTVPPSGRTLSGGLDPAALHMPKRFFGAARNMKEGGSLTILATALVDTGSKMDDVVYEEFKGTGNMEIVLDRKLSERRVFPAIDIPKSSTRRDDLLLEKEQLDTINMMRRAFNGVKPEEAVERIVEMFVKTKNNRDFMEMAKKYRFI
ncbi:MAG: transcription termination factor Rho [Lachnospiraceae bacterium]|nr:transcription termination factor Rho [Lachnospiraceae bacterium]